MKTTSNSKGITVDNDSLTPKYLQISASVVHNIKRGTIKKNHLLPTINELSASLKISRDTVERGYKELKRIGVIESVPGKGYFVANTRHEKPVKVVFFFNRLNESNKMMFETFADALGHYAGTEYYVYHNDYSLFQQLVNEKKDRNTYLVIIPQFDSHEKRAIKFISTLHKNRVVLLDKKNPGIDFKFTELYLKILKHAGTAQFKNN